MKELVEILRRNPLDRFVLCDQPLAHHLHANPHGGGAGPLRSPRLQHVELIVLERELDVLHVLEVILELRGEPLQVAVDLGEPPFGAFHLRDRLRCARPGDDVFALRVGEVVAIQHALPRAAITRERDAGAAIVSHVAVHHGHDVHGGTETVGDVVELAIVFRAACVPTLEDGFDRSPELLLWIVGEGPPRPRLHDRPELPDQCPQVLGGKIDVPLDLATRFGLGEDLFKRLFAEIKDDITVHLDETAVGIVGEARIIGAGNQPFDGLIVEAQVQNGLHHPRHRDGGARADRDEQRIPRVAQSLARDFFQLLQVAIDFGAERRGERAFFEIGDAELGGDREAGRDGKSQIGHLR